MASKTIAWTTGGGNITLSYTGQGNGSVSVSSSQNDSFDARSQKIYLSTTLGTPEQNIAVTITQQGKSYSPGDVFNFDYTGSVQSVVLPKGKYKLQCWGAQGGSVTGTYSVNGSKGGYSEGVLTLTEKTTLYVFVGGQGASYTSSATQTSTSLVNGGWNGGGAGRRTSLYDSNDINGRSFPRGGGGATDIALVTSEVSYSSGRTTRDSASLLSRIIVAGGGAGASARYTEETTTTTDTTETKIGTLTSAANSVYYSASNYTSFILTGASDLSAGKKYKRKGTIGSGILSYLLYYRNASGTTKYYYISGSTTTFTVPSDYSTFAYWDFRYSGNLQGQAFPGNLTIYQVEETTTTSTSTSNSKSNQSQQGGGTSGEGQYPGTQTSAGSGGAFGLGANQTTTGDRYCSGGGGGGWYGGGKSSSDSSTSYINYSGGGSGFVNTAANASSRPSGYTGLQLDSGTTTAGNTSHPSTSGGTETGHSGNGYARITVI